jgi:hypothetical protein
MKSSSNKKYTEQAQRCIKGESFFESIISEFAIPHHIVGQKDIGIDYICEWVFGDKPTGVLFAVQIKTFAHSSAKINFKVKNGQNRLDEYKISNPNFKIDIDTLKYWQGLGMPAFLFAVLDDDDGKLKCFYKRYTSILTKDEISLSGFDYQDKFYKVSEDVRFKAFADMKERTNGFARDLFIDHIRWNYFKGSIVYLNPRSLGLKQFPEDNIFPELFNEYKDKISLTYSKTEKYLRKVYPDYKPISNINFSTAATASPIGTGFKKL